MIDAAGLQAHLPLVRLALFAWCLAVWAFAAWALRPTPAERRAAVMAAWVHAAVSTGLDVLAVQVGAWEYRRMPFALGGVPLDLHLDWGIVWGFLPLWLYSRAPPPRRKCGGNRNRIPRRRRPCAEEGVPDRNGIPRRRRPCAEEGVPCGGSRCDRCARRGGRHRGFPARFVSGWALGTVALDAGVGHALPFLARRAPWWWLADALLLLAVQGVALWVYLSILHPSQHPVRQAWNCRLRSLFYVGSLGALFYGFLPAVVLSLTGGWGVRPLFGLEDPRRLAGALAPPCLLGAWATLAFTDAGHGTPLPPDPPRRLVTTGPYAFVRNPMQIAGLGLAAMLVLYFPTPYMLIYALDMALVAVVLFAPHERAQLEAAFSDDYRRYAASVRNWLPRVRPYDPAELEAAPRASGKLGPRA
jgi:protein-S-isoprenylcysteine O-methyltransferase Ste14